MKSFQSFWGGWLPVSVVFVVLVCFGESTLGAETFTWRDAEGRRYFSDRPPLDGSDHVPLAVAPLWSPGREYTEAFSEAAQELPEPAAIRASRVSKPAKKIISAADYDLSPTILVSGRDLSVRGRINGGPECENLKLRFSLKNEHGRAVVVSALVANAGGHFGSTIYVGTSHLNKANYGQHWVVVDRQAVCK